MIRLRGRPRKPKPPKPPRTCKICGAVITRKSAIYCEACGERHRKNMQRENSKRYNANGRELRAYRLEHHLCTFCGAELPQDETHHMCADCRSFRADKEDARYKRNIMQRRCPKCREKLPDGYWYVHCEKCRQKDNMRRNKRREKA